MVHTNASCIHCGKNPYQGALANGVGQQVSHPMQKDHPTLEEATHRVFMAGLAYASAQQVEREAYKRAKDAIETFEKKREKVKDADNTADS